jgi:hypothetical protein
MADRPIYVRREVAVAVSVQAQKVLSYTDFSVDDFVDWMLDKRRISFGGNNVVEFLEDKGMRE